MYRRHRVCFLLALAVALALLLAAPFSAVASPAPPDISCSHCISTGYPFRCRVAISSNDCFYLAGDAHCVGSECTCCRLDYTKGCERCETTEDEDHLVEDDAELLGEDL